MAWRDSLYSRIFDTRRSADGAGCRGPADQPHSPRHGGDLAAIAQPDKDRRGSAIADILSDGRLEFGVGRGIARHYASYGIPPEESRGRFDEALDFILAAWTNDSFSFDGKYFQARELTLVPRPVQTPHPPVRIAANSPDTFPLAARDRLPIFASPLINPPDKLKAGLVVYRQGLPAGTVNDTALAFPVHVASSRAQARAECEPGLLRFLRVATEAALPSVQGDPKSFEAFRQVRARMERVTYADMDREMGVFGDPKYCIARLGSCRPSMVLTSSSAISTREG